MERRWALTVRGLMTRASAIWASVSPCATRRSTSPSRSVSPCGYAGERPRCVASLAFAPGLAGVRSAFTGWFCAASACSGVIARPSAQASVKSRTPSSVRTALTVRSCSIRSAFVRSTGRKKGPLGPSTPERFSAALQSRAAQSRFPCPATPAPRPCRQNAMPSGSSTCRNNDMLSSQQLRAAASSPCMVATRASQERTCAALCCSLIALGKEDASQMQQGPDKVLLVVHLLKEDPAFFQQRAGLVILAPIDGGNRAEQEQVRQASRVARFQGLCTALFEQEVNLAVIALSQGEQAQPAQRRRHVLCLAGLARRAIQLQPFLAQHLCPVHVPLVERQIPCPTECPGPHGWWNPFAVLSS